MKLAVFGATGGVGRHVIAQALQRGHTVRALVRTPSRAPFPPTVEIVAGDALDCAAVAETVSGADAVLSCLGAKLTATFTRSGRIVAPATREIVEAMYWHGVRRLIAISTYGVGDSWGQLSLSARILMRVLLWGERADKSAMESAVTASLLDWTIVRPVNLTDGPPAGWSLAHVSRRIGLRDTIPRTDVAAFMLAALHDDREMLGRSLILVGR
ncbi:MAG: NAD(P)-dependent oxidoreductase [Vitreimonas sp.]